MQIWRLRGQRLSQFFLSPLASSSLAGRIAEEGKSREAHEFIALRALLLDRLDSQLPKCIPKVRLFYCQGPSVLLCQIKSA
jgi:hypothetical protein